jgi:ATPase subunit of ABC transporter with duplicated ATPase domains
LEEAIKTKVSTLSGGERNRLHDDFKEEGNVLLLDEPTNDLDINTPCFRGRSR